MPESHISTSISAGTRFVGLLGSGIRFSLSPQIHNLSAQILGIDCIYLALDSQSRHFPGPAFFDSLWDVGCLGFNVTVPFKMDAARFIPESHCRSVNTIYRGLNRWQAATTDAEGFLLALDELGFGLTDFSSIVLLGNGGASLALYEHLLQVCNLPLYVLRRNPLADQSWQRPSGRSNFDDLSLSTLQKIIAIQPKSLLIQTTSAPLHGEILEFLTPALQGLEGAFIDLVYGSPSALFGEAKRLGIPAQDGIPMLIAQALLSQKLWWNNSAPYGEVESALRRHMALQVAKGG
ncbi:MAG: hypothetical protein NTX25_06705 [Proteobacteria bacterium]|nr:hypothetical protein [Pseudomonadota bacterium]